MYSSYFNLLSVYGHRSGQVICSVNCYGDDDEHTEILIRIYASGFIKIEL